MIGSDHETVADIRIHDGRIAEMGVDLPGDSETPEFDCRGHWVGPGLVDIHTHLREPGHEHKEDIASGSAAAAAGGYTAVVAMPNTLPPIDSAVVARLVAERGRAAGLVDVHPAGALTVGRAGAAVADYGDMWEAGVRIFTDDGDTVENEALLREAMVRLRTLGGVVAQHAIDPRHAVDRHMHEGDISAGLGLEGIPSSAESSIVARDLDLVRATGVAYHAQHVSTSLTVELIAAAKAEGLDVTAEVTPHHLAFDESYLDSADPNFKMMPPLRTTSDRDALRAGVIDGTIDAVATDHAPHAPQEKAGGFLVAPFGVVGLADAASVTNTVLSLDPRQFFERMSVAPARIAGIGEHGRWPEPGGAANLIVFDPTQERRSTTTHSRSQNSPFLGRVWRGHVRCTVMRGRVSYRSTESALL